MSEPLVLVVLLGTATDPTTETMLSTARRALGPDAVVLVDTSEVASDQEALMIGERVKARAVARIRWPDGTANVAHLHVHVAPTDGWTDEQIAFAPQDASNEKGRTLGYTLSSMVQRIERAQEEEVEAKPPPPAAARADTVPRDVGTASPKKDTRDLDLFVHGVGALDDVGGSLGVSGGVRWWPARHLGLRGAVGGRVGELPHAQATTTALLGSAGIGYRTTIGTALEVGARSDFVFYRHSVTRTEGGLAAMRGRWLSAAQFVLEASWALHPTFALAVGAGAEVAFGTTAVNVGGRAVADIPSVRAIAELGARIRF
jgi:hypothetical protein